MKHDTLSENYIMYPIPRKASINKNLFLVELRRFQNRFCQSSFATLRNQFFSQFVLFSKLIMTGDSECLGTYLIIWPDTDVLWRLPAETQYNDTQHYTHRRSYWIWQNSKSTLRIQRYRESEKSIFTNCTLVADYVSERMSHYGLLSATNMKWS